jgi:hypothetical protein
MGLLVHWRKATLGAVVLLLLAAECGVAQASTATLLLEEPYGKLGFFTATGHAAVYLSGVCAETPVVLRPCRPGEAGVVISRYNGVNGYDWVAIPLIPYLYAVERPEDVPLFADAKLVAFLRDRYRRTYLEEIAPDEKSGATPGGNWYELVGTSYDRTVYGFEVVTTSQQDEALIRKLNAAPNHSHFRTVSKNCADFAKDIINFYYPKALHRSVISDFGITTPKQIAKTMIRFGTKHPKTDFSRLVIAQVPGSMPRSAPVHGVVDAFFTSKKYIVPSAVVSPIFAGCVAAVYVGTGSVRFDPARNAMVFVVGGSPEPPLSREDQRAYKLELKHLLAGAYPERSEANVDHAWERLQSKAQHAVDEEGRPVLQMQLGEDMVRIGVSAGNVLDGSAPPQLVRQLLEARLQSELRRKSSARLTESEVARDWKLLQVALQTNDPGSNISNRANVQLSDGILGNRR